MDEAHNDALKLNRLWLRLTLLFIAMSILSWPIGCSTTTILEADNQRQWVRGNMHTHSHWSDGDDYLDMIALWYREQGYQFLVFTDHNVLAKSQRWINVERSKGGQQAFDKLKTRFPSHVEQRISEMGVLEVRLNTFREIADRMNETGKFLLIQGEEITDSFNNRPVHLNVSNIQQLIPPMHGQSITETIQNNIDAALDQQKRTGEPMIIHLNHPNFQYAVTAEDMMRVRGERFFEVFNGHPGVHNVGDKLHAGTERIWDILLTRRLAEFNLPPLYGLATDDSHKYHEYSSGKSNPGRGWVMVLVDKLSARSLVESLEAGRFYASSGVTLRRIKASATHFNIEVEPVEGETYKIEFIGTRRGYDATSFPVVDDQGKEIRTTRRYSDDIGETFATITGTTASYCFTGDEIYVRARVTSSATLENTIDDDMQKRAWCQPVIRIGK